MRSALWVRRCEQLLGALAKFVDLQQQRLSFAGILNLTAGEIETERGVLIGERVVVAKSVDIKTEISGNST
jgi:hypothetical protein